MPGQDPEASSDAPGESSEPPDVGGGAADAPEAASPPTLPATRNRDVGHRLGYSFGVGIALIGMLLGAWVALRIVIWIGAFLLGGGNQLDIIAQVVRPSSGHDMAAEPLADTAGHTDGDAAPDDGADGPDGPRSHSITGRVTHAGNPLPDVIVWAVIEDTFGNRVSSDSDKTMPDGNFTLSYTLTTGGKVAGVSIFAREVTGDAVRPSPLQRLWRLLTGLSDEAREGRERLRIDQTTGAVRRTVQLKVHRLLVIVPVGIFLFSVLNAFVIVRRWVRFGYLLALGSSVALTVTMITVIAVGLYQVSASEESEDVVSLGFASILRGTYVKDGTPQTLFTLTTPRKVDQAAAADEPEKGFGAPLWVMLLSVAGAGLLTMALVVREAGDLPPREMLARYVNEEQVEEYLAARGATVQPGALTGVSDRIKVMLEHQFYMMFAPLGAVFVYQLLVLAEAAGSPVTVAIAAMGSGASLNKLLQVAVQRAGEALDRGHREGR